MYTTELPAVHMYTAEPLTVIAAVEQPPINDLGMKRPGEDRRRKSIGWHRLMEWKHLSKRNLPAKEEETL